MFHQEIGAGIQTHIQESLALTTRQGLQTETILVEISMILCSLH